MWFLKIILVMITFCRAFGEDSFSHDFGDNFQDVFKSETGICSGLRPWSQYDYDTTIIPAPDPNSPKFVQPQSTLSCMFSEDFSMAPGGQLQLSVYMSLTSSLDQVRLLVYQDNQVVGQITSSLDHSNFNQDRWNTLNVTIDSIDTFDGFVAMIGRTTTDSYILVDRLQYLPPVPEAEGDGDTEEDNSIDSSEDGNTSEEDNEAVPVECIEYDFGESFDFLFEGTRIICSNFDQEWEASVVSDEIFGMKPKIENTLSCTSASEFPISISGTLYVKVRIESESDFDLISVGINDEEGEIHFVHYGKIVSANFTTGSHTLEIPVNTREGYNVQITFMGLATRGATVLVEHLQFMPSLWNEEECISLAAMRRQV